MERFGNVKSVLLCLMKNLQRDRKTAKMSMKIVEIGSGASTKAYDNVTMKKGAKQNKFGCMYYLSEKVYLRKSTPVMDYSTRTSDDGKLHLVLSYDKDLKDELELLQSILKDKNAELEFKGHVEGDRHFLKMDE